MVRAEVPVKIVPSATHAERQRAKDLGLLMRILLQEEQQALQVALSDARDRCGTVGNLGSSSLQ